MALWIDGMDCRLCGKPMAGEEGVIAFPPFARGEHDPLWAFSDGVFHAAYFALHPLAELVLARVKESEERNAQWPPDCFLRGGVIATHDEFFSFDALTDDKADPLYLYNHKRAHRSCLRRWPQLEPVREMLELSRRAPEAEVSTLSRALKTLKSLATQA